MKVSLQNLVGLGLMAALLVGCPKPPPPPPKIEEPPPPPPPPKCESLDEKCKAGDSTKLVIPGVKYAITAPADWVYAVDDKVAATQKRKKGAALVFTSYEAEKGKLKQTKQRKDKVGELVSFLDVEANTDSFDFKRDEKAGELKLSLGEVVDVSRKGKEGFLLLVSTDADGRKVLGVGFAPAGDQESTKAILAAIRGIEKAAANDDDGDKDDGDKDDGDDGDGKGDSKGDSK